MGVPNAGSRSPDSNSVDGQIVGENHYFTALNYSRVDQNDLALSSSQNASSSSPLTNLVEKERYHVLDMEIDDLSVKALQTGFCYQEKADIPLLKYNEIADYQKGNPFVVEGYRPKLPVTMCIKSVLIWTNETINIWSHFVGFYIFLLLALRDNLLILPRIEGSLADHVIVTLGLMCYMYCMLCSTGFHLFCCHSERASRRWLAIDMTGVSIGIIGCYLPTVHYAFYCISTWREIYTIFTAVLVVCTLVFQLNDRFFTHGWFCYRVSIYVGVTAYGIIPTVHWVYLNGGVSSVIVQMFLPKVIVMYALFGSAFFIYITKLPERICPGKFDYIGASHQLWHILIVGAFYYWHMAGQEFIHYRISNQCRS